MTKLNRPEQIQILFKNALDSVVGMDHHGEIIEWNGRSELLFGWSEEEILGRKVSETIIPQRYRAAHELGLANFFKTETGPVLNARLELAAVKKSGIEIPVELTVTPIKTDQSFVFYAFLRDLSERKKVEDQMMKSSHHLKTIMNHIADGVITINEKFLIESWNIAARNIFGYEYEEVVGKNIKILMPEPYQSEHDEKITKYLKTGKANIIGTVREVVGKHKDGRVFPMDLAVSEFKIGDQFFFTGVVRDITNRKNKMDRILTAKESAETASQMKSAFLAHMSHEIRTPLGAILGFSELLANAKNESEEKANYIAAIKRNSELLIGIVDDILDLSKVEAGKINIESVEVNLAEKLSEVISSLKFKAINKGIMLSGYCDKSIPQTVVTDPLRLKQILLNIIGNAIKFTTKGSVEVIARLLSADEAEGKIAFDIKDTGIGLTKEQSQSLFQPFSQADVSIKKIFGGTGLGLTISKNLANLLGGDVVLLESTLGRGSVFRVIIDPNISAKVSVKKSDQNPAAKQLSLKLDVDINLCGKKVLLAEDSIDNQLVFSEFLKMTGAEVDVAENGAIALEKATQRNYDAILMDIQMPQMDGYEATSRLRTQGCIVPIIALTAHALNDEHRHCLRSGFNGYIRKPVDFSMFIKIVARHVFGLK